MVDWGAYTLVFIAGFITALATGIGAFPFFFVADVSDRLNVALWGVASGIMVIASVFGLIPEALEVGEPLDGHGYRELAVGFITGGVAMIGLLAVG